MTEHRWQVVRIEADHVPDQNAGQRRHVAVHAVHHHREPRGYLADQWLSGTRRGLELLAHQAPGRDQHQSIDQLANTGARRAAIERQLYLDLRVGQMPGDIDGIARGAGDHRVQGGAPGVKRVRDEVNVFCGNLRHGGSSCDLGGQMGGAMAAPWYIGAPLR
ncbi:hypothetical protein P3W55_28970 [Pseudomonas citronellolis]|uniref:Uncharacterized protein n=1 Tax=Pseudomonas citronellolis TaxID=53408 RepID=A0AAW6PHY0_9PSED|nr:hypothetical protein [Pseudomonas citronellolis]MDF3845759.1 hypothetical protein [Pseudomonas citronellolis]